MLMNEKRNFKQNRMSQMFGEPMGYIDGPNKYQFELSDPIALVDPEGTAATLPNPGGNWGPVNPTTGQPSYLPAIPGGWKPVASDHYDPTSPYSRPGKWVPKTPVKGTGGGQPSGSWDPVPSTKYPKGHGDVMDGKGGRKHVDEDGNDLSSADAHDFTPCDGQNLVDLKDDDGVVYDSIPLAQYNAQVDAARLAEYNAQMAKCKAAWAAKPFLYRVWNWRSSPDAQPAPTLQIPGVNPLLGGSGGGGAGVEVPETGPIGIPIIE